MSSIKLLDIRSRNLNRAVNIGSIHICKDVRVEEG